MLESQRNELIHLVGVAQKHATDYRRAAESPTSSAAVRRLCAMMARNMEAVVRSIKMVTEFEVGENTKGGDGGGGL